ncbi:MAG: helix-turn-helix domain-containing protein [Candidatus Nanoarchaeia archaeon]|nr:helix-turn-helix domain-containing protein [Candidatus Nanoarchaeia archaeon]
MEIGGLLEIGLTEREARTYLVLLELGLVTTGPIIKKARIPSSKIYEVLGSLENKGLVSWIIKGKTKYFQASDPKKILTIFKEKEKKIEGLVSILKSKENKSKEKTFAEFLEGSKAIFSFLNQLIEDSKRGEVYYAFSLGEEHKDKQIQTFYRRFGIKREEKGLVVKILAKKEVKKIYEDVYSDREKFLKKIVRYIDFDFPQGITIFRDNLLIVNWTQDPIAVHIQSEKITRQYKQLFETLWRQAEY